ncbi:MAG: 30S ribosomal protein S20 [Candidatus Nomurabacteria bacterium]|nr:30S ribosomal protein S20 [Candidatus Nomurabacteria bacterium]
MPITKSAEKAMRGSLRKKGINDRRKRAMKEIVKTMDKVVKTDKKGASEMLSKAYQAIDKAAKRGVIKKNTAARKKARLSRLVK